MDEFWFFCIVIFDNSMFSEIVKYRVKNYEFMKIRHQIRLKKNWKWLFGATHVYCKCRLNQNDFMNWKRIVSDRVSKFKLKIKESYWEEPTSKHAPVNFLEIQLLFDKKRNLKTDLYQNLTDARCYLNIRDKSGNSHF